MDNSNQFLKTRFTNSENRWGWLAIIMHWLSAIAVIAMFVFGLWMVQLDYYDAWYQQAPMLHKSTGITLFLLTLLRLVWRLTNTTPEPLRSHSQFEIKASHAVHGLLYLLLFAIMLSGYLISTADGRAISVFKLFEIPAIIYGIDKQEDTAGTIHLILAILLIVTAMLHAGAAIKHHLIDKDETLNRMTGR